MRRIDFYIDMAKEKQGLSSDNALNKTMGFKGSTMSYLRLGKSHLSDEKMIELARLGGLDETTALMDLNMWRTSNPIVQKAYANILHRLSHAAVIAVATFTIFCAFASNSMASPIAKNCQADNEIIYIMELKHILKRLWINSKRRINSLLKFSYYKCQVPAYG